MFISIKQVMRCHSLIFKLSAIFDFFGAYFYHPRRVVVGLYRCAKFSWDQCSTFDNKVFNIWSIWLESRPKNCVFPPKKVGL